ncbi:MAG: amino acid adenylation domain-containing protein, partial [Lysobacter sp.]
TDLFETATVRRFAERFRVLLESVVEDPSCSVARIALLPHEERQLSLSTWNSTTVEYSESRPLHEIIDAYADAHPDQIAVRCEGQSLSYGELKHRSDDMARFLSARGVGVDTCVGVFLHRSLELMVALLGVLKTGGAYVPVDPDYPPERIRHIVSAAGLSSLLTSTHLRDAVQALGMEAVCIDEPHLFATAGTWRAPKVEGSNLAYVIFTSGSTGQPKGVMNTHEAIVNRLVWMQDAYQLQPGERVLQKTPFSFDVSVWEFFWPLMAGAVVVFARPGGHRDVDYLNEVMRDEHITTLHFVPSMLQVFLETDGVHLPHLRQVVCSGEELPAALTRRFFERFPNTRLHNLYGPTEAAVDVSQWPCSPEDANARIPIGHPIANTRLYILDADYQPVPVGVPGELYIGGIGLARGYLARPDLTAERFVPDPWSGQPGERLYRSGDVARFRADGAIEYLGRIDHQVKLRGFRIELGEVEAALTQLPGVHEAVVVVRGEGAAKVLLAYVAGEGLEASVLKAGLESRLPGYMVPSALMVLDALPLTPNGKVDRQGLPAIEMARGEQAQLAPQTPRERAVAAVWCDVLGLDDVGVGENFFDLGGHSLLAAKLVAKLRSNDGLVLRVRDVFEAPTVAAQAQRAQRLADAELALLPVARGQDEPLSFAQQRLWFLTQLEGANATYNMPHAVRLHGALDVAALRASVTGVVARHEVLRTVYGYRDGQPRQQVRAVDAFEMGWEDWRDHDAATREAALSTRVHYECTRAFALESDLPLRVTLLQLGEQEHVMLLCLHHIAGDGWSVEVLWRELEEGYRAALSGQPAPAAPAVQYIDYAHWQREWLAAPRQGAQLGYWRERLEGMTPLLELPTDRPRPAVQRYVGSSMAVSVPAELVPAIRQVSQAEQASVFMTLLAVFQVVLAKYSGQEDIAVGSPVANRPRDELGSLIGFFANTLVLRSRVRSTQTFRTLLREVRETTLAAYEHQDVPFEQLVEALQPARSLSHSPLFQVMFNLQHGGAETIDLPGMEARVLESGSNVAKFDLTLTLQDRAGRLDGTLEYNSDLFDASSIERLWQHYVTVLQQVLAQQDRVLGRLELLTADEREQQAAWNRTEAWYPAQACVHTLFEAQAAATPDAVAVVCDGDELSYGELNARANRLAHALREEGVTAEVTVGVCLPRTPELIVALLAILKAGGAYVPLDPQYPLARLAHILGNAVPRVVLTDVDGRDRLAALIPPGTLLLLPDERRDELAQTSDCNLTAVADPAQLAYVIYTSGSTGRPKGVAITHANAVAMLAWGERTFAANALRYTLASTSICFDLSVFELFLPLGTGNTVVLVRDALALVEQPPQWPVSLVNTVPSAMEALLALDALPSTVHVVNLAGEALSRSLVDKLHTRPHVEAVYNLYGPSEDTTYSTGCRVEGDSTDAPSIGRPIDNTRAFVLDADLMPVPVGVKGELYLAGAGLSRGYLHQPDLTAERYVPNAFAATPGERLYRTGDIVRHLPDGRLAYLGRADHQIKLRGFRIELGEIESVLAACPGVREAVALVRKIGEGVETLVAFLHAEDGAHTTGDALRLAVVGLLPDYMIPSQLIFLDAMPLTTNGKIDRKALHELPFEVVSSDTYEPPASETEVRLAALWQEVLGVTRVGRNEDFFAAGGHSLLATSLNTRILGAFAVRTTVRDVFLHPRLAELAECIDNLHWMAAPAVGEAARDQAVPDDFEVGVL